MRMKKTGIYAAAVLLGMSAPSLAYEAGDRVIRAGLATVMPASDNGDTAEVDEAWGLGISVSYMLTPTLGVEVLGAAPFKHDIKSAASGDTIGEASHLPPTLLLNYHFPVMGAFQSYAGVGINHTFFFDEEIDSAVAADMELDSSTGLALQLGSDYRINEHWAFNVAAWYIDIDTEATLRDGAGNVAARADVEIDPWVALIGAAYRF